MRAALLLPLLLTLPSCGLISTKAQIEPALQNAAILRDVFDRGMTANEELVKKSGPSAEVLAAYLDGQRRVRESFALAYAAHTAHLGSLGGLSAEAVASLLDAVVEATK